MIFCQCYTIVVTLYFEAQPNERGQSTSYDAWRWVMREMQENYYLVLFMFSCQLYFYVLGPISLLGY